jgi:hypothetical protein
LAIPTVALLNGSAFGGGCELAIACDFRIAASDVTLAALPADGDLNPYSAIDPTDFAIDKLTAARGPERHVYPLQQSWPDEQDVPTPGTPQAAAAGVQKNERGGGGSTVPPDTTAGAVSATAFELLVPIVKSEDEQRIAYGVVLAPGQLDSQGDVVDETEIERAAHRFLDLYREYDVEHDGGQFQDAHVVESYVAPVDMVLEDARGRQVPVRKGSWLMATQFDETDIGRELWTRVKKGQEMPDDPEAITGYSIEGSALRRAIAEEVLS